MTIADDLRKMSGDNYPRHKRFTVSAVNDDDLTVNLDSGDGTPLNGVLCLSSYVNRNIGDLVVVVMFGPSTASWIVVGAYGAAAPDLIFQSDLDAAINGVKRLIPDLPPTVSASMGNAAPTGSGWQQASVLPFMRDDGNGARSIYFQLGTAVTPSGPPPPPPAATPDPVTIHPNNGRSYRTSGQSDPELIQGDWEGRPWTAALFYGNQIANACAGKTVKSIQLTLARQNDSSGWNRSVTVHIGTHGHATRSPTNKLNNLKSFVGLEHGQRRTYTLTTAQVNALKSGSDLGIGMGGGTSDYLKFTVGSGALLITFE